MNASHLRRQGRFTLWLPAHPKTPSAPPDHAWYTGKCSINVTCCILIIVIICLSPSGTGEEAVRKRPAAPAGRGRRGPAGEGEDYPCRCQSERWGPLCGRRRGRGSPRTAPFPSSCRPAGGRTPGSTSSRPARLSPRGHKSAASRGTGLGTGWGSAESQRPGDRRDKERPLSRDNRRRSDPGAQQRQLVRQSNQGHLRGARHLPVPGGGGAGKPGKGTAWATRDSCFAHSACSGFSLPLLRNETFYAVDWLCAPFPWSGGGLPSPAPPAQVL